MADRDTSHMFLVILNKMLSLIPFQDSQLTLIQLKRRISSCDILSLTRW